MASSSTDLAKLNETTLPALAEDPELTADIEIARENLKKLVQQASDYLPGLLQLADQSQHPRAYEVLAGYLKMAGELNKDLVTVAVSKSVAKSRGRGENGGVVNQNLFVTTRELAEMLRGTGGPSKL